MSFSSTGFEVDSHSTIMTRIYEAFSSVLPTLEFTPDNIITHWQEILAYEQRLTQIMLLDAINNFSVLSATGVFLDRLGIEAGIIKKGSVNAAGNVYVNSNVDSEGIILSGSIFSTETSLNFISTEQRAFLEVITGTRGYGSTDDVPSPYANVTIDSIYADTEADVSNLVSDTLYAVSGDTITWTPDSFSTVVAGSIYAMKLTGTVDLIAPVVAEAAGTDYNVSADRIVNDANGYTFVNSVTNPDPFYTGADVESDDDYKYRIMKAKRKTFSLGRIESLVENVNGIRAAKTYQVTNTDKNSITPTGWEINNLTGFQATAILPAGEWFGFSFKPSDEIATIKEVKMYGRTQGDVVPKLEYYLKDHYAGANITDTDIYLAKNSIEKEDLERDNITGWQEITLPIKYNGLDNSKTYKLYLRETGWENETSGHWEFAYSGIAVSSGYTEETYIDGTGQSDKQLLYRTMYGAPAYNIDVIVEDGYRFDPEIYDEIDKILNYEEYEGNSPVCIQYDIRRASKVYMSMSVYVYPEDEYSFADIISDVKTNVGKYLRSVRSNEIIYYTKVENAILNTNGVKKISSLQIKINDGDWSTRSDQNDIGLGDQEYADLDLLNSYTGITILEG